MDYTKTRAIKEAIESSIARAEEAAPECLSCGDKRELRPCSIALNWTGDYTVEAAVRTEWADKAKDGSPWLELSGAAPDWKAEGVVCSSCAIRKGLRPKPAPIAVELVPAPEAPAVAPKVQDADVPF